MKTIRNNIFETNSSSSHSISIRYNPFIKDNSLVPYNGEIRIDTGEFGWEWKKYNDAYTKASYFLTRFKHDESMLEMLKEVISKNCENCSIVLEIDDYQNGYIDHQSTNTLDDIISSDELENFIFNKNCWLYLGNDNEYAPKGFYKD